LNASLLESVLRRVAPLAAGVRTVDAELLRRFALHRDESAFAVLVQRHGRMVWTVCRNLLPLETDAEDAFQATFLALIRSAATIRTPGSLGSWLYGVAFRVAQKARRAAVRRRRREQTVASGEAVLPVSAGSWDKLQAAVHLEVNRLPEKLRIAFVVCELEGTSQREAAAALGWKPGTLSARLTKARQRLLQRLAQRGITVGTLVAGALIGGAGSAATPLEVTMRTLVQARSGNCLDGVISATVLNLARGATGVSMTRMKLMAAAVALTATLAIGTVTTLAPLAIAQRPAANDPFAPSPPQPGTTGVPSGNSANFAGATLSVAGQWEYKFVPRKSESLEDFEKLLVENGAAGWEYCGVESLSAGAARKAQWGTSPTIVFKRPKKAPRTTFDPLMTGPSAGSSSLPAPRAGSAGSFGPTGSGGGSAAPGQDGSMGGRGGGSYPQSPKQETSIVQLANAASTSLGQTLSQVFQGRCRIVPDQGTNSLIIQGDKETIAEVMAVIHKLDVPPAKPGAK
jgi:RNA polymerase sigma factor (sigma-70 family)